jgi:hypothetical protein
MCMALTHRLQVLVSPERFADLEAEARREGTSIGAVVREAIDARLGDDEAANRRAAAFRALLDEPNPEGLEPDWEVVKAQMLDDWSRPPA